MMAKLRSIKRGASTIQMVGLGMGVLAIAGFGLLPFLGSNGGNPSGPQAEERQELISQYLEENGFAAIVGDSPRKGAENPKVILFEFSDFQCPFCAQAAPAVAELLAKHGDTVLVVYKHLPLAQIHPEAVPAARASWAAEQQGKFWEYHDALFANQEALGDDLYVQIAEELELDIERFNEDRDSRESRAAIETDLALTRELQLNSTPTFVMNNVLLPPVLPSLELFEDVLETLENQEPNS
ncbi:MAG: DsbA family protein [Synechococcus sp.]